MKRRALMALLLTLMGGPALAQAPLALIFFEPHSALISDAGLDMLRRAADEGKRRGGVIEVRGFADPEGGIPYNRALSLARAEHVAHVLREAGMAADHLRIVARGPVAAILDDQESRRVEVRLLP